MREAMPSNSSFRNNFQKLAWTSCHHPWCWNQPGPSPGPPLPGVDGALQGLLALIQPTCPMWAWRTFRAIVLFGWVL